MTEQTQAVAEPSVADFRAMFASKTQVVTPETPVAPTATATPEVPTTPPAQEATATPEAETKTESTEPERDEKGRFKAKEATEEGQQPEPDADLSPNVQKRIGKAVAKQREAERQAEALRLRIAELEALRDGNPQEKTPATVASDKPKSDDFDTWEAYQEALTDWKVEQKLAQREKEQQAKAQETAIQAKTREAREKYPDFDNIAFAPEVVALIKVNPAVGNAITESPIFADIAMHLGQNPSELARIVELSPYRAIAEIGKLETQLTAPKQSSTTTPKPTPAPLPKPPTALAANAASTTPPQSEWNAAQWREYFANKRRF